MPNPPTESTPRTGWTGAKIASDGPLVDGADVEVCVVGAGIAGLSVAHELARRGRSVMVLEARSAGAGETLRTTAHLASALDDRWFEIERMHGVETAALVARSHRDAIDAIERIAASERIPCGFRRVDGILAVPEEFADRSDELLRQELDACRRVGIDAEVLDRGPFEGDWCGRCLRIPRQGQIDPRAYLDGLAACCRRLGVRLHTDSPALTVSGGADAEVVARGHRVRCRFVVVATNTPVNDRLVMHTKQSAYRTYVVSIEAAESDPARVLLWDGFWSADVPYHYVRTATLADEAGQASPMLLVGGEDHKTGQPDPDRDPFAELERWARERFPRLGRVVHRWSGQVMEPHDHLAYIGRNPLDADNVFVVTGDSGNGMTHGAMSGPLIADLIDGIESPLAHVYRPSRLAGRAAWRFACENTNTAAQYAAWALPSEARDVEEVTPGTGAIVRSGLHRLAVHRDEAGSVTMRSAVCPHLGGVVRWNPVERTWDCPCHGSRFTPRGEVLNGPAAQGLAAP